MNRSIIGFLLSFISFLSINSCTKKNPANPIIPDNAYFRFTAGTTTITVSGNYDSAMKTGMGIYAIKFSATSTWPTYYHIKGSDKWIYYITSRTNNSMGMSMQTDSLKVQTYIIEGHTAPQDCRLTLNLDDYNSLYQGSLKVNITRYSNGTLDGNFDGLLYSTFKSTTVNGEFKNVIVKYF